MYVFLVKPIASVAVIKSSTYPYPATIFFFYVPHKVLFLKFHGSRIFQHPSVWFPQDFAGLATGLVRHAHSSCGSTSSPRLML
jgi:hypothetical protein